MLWLKHKKDRVTIKRNQETQQHQFRERRSRIQLYIYLEIVTR